MAFQIWTPGQQNMFIPEPKKTTTTTKVNYVDKYGNPLPGPGVGTANESPPGSSYDVLKPDALMINPVTGDLVNVYDGTVIKHGSSLTTQESGGGGGGRSGGGGGGGGGPTVPSATIRDWFQYYYGSTPAGLMQQAEENNWTEQDVINRAIADGRSSTGLNILRDNIKKAAAPFYDGDPTGIPNNLVDTLIKEGYWTSDGLTYLVNKYFPQFRGVKATNPLAAPWVERWVEMTGRSMGPTAMNKMEELVRTYGFTETGMTAWEAWLKTTDSAYTGNWGAEKRADITNIIGSVLGRAPTQAELARNGPYWNLDTSAILESIRGTDEYEAIYSGKPAWMSESEYISDAMAYDWVFRWYYGDQTILNDDGSLTIPHGPYYQEPAPNVTPEWKSLPMETFVNEVAKVGVTVVDGKYMKDGVVLTPDELLALLPPGEFYYDEQGFHYTQQPGAVNPKTGAVTPGPTGTSTAQRPEWKTLTNEMFAAEVAKVGVTAVNGKYMKDGVELTPDQLLALLPPGQFYHDAQGYHYVQEPGAVNPKTGAVTPGAPATPSTYSGGFGNWGMSYVTPNMVDVLHAHNITPENLQQQFQWTEEAAYYEGVYGPMLEETGMGEGIDWYTYASGARGSGAMKAQVMQAQNTYAFKEVFHTYTGRNPTASDYKYLTENFVSPNEYAKTMAAYESAQAKLPEINDVMQRVMGRTLTVEDVQNMVLGREGSGATQALITQAMKLDAFTWPFKQDQGRDPTPEEYASFAGYTGPEELVWKITTRERIAENAPVIQQLWRDVYKRELTPEELQILFGEQAGSGALKAQWTAALKQQQEKEAAEQAALNAPRASTPFVAATQGGFQVAVKPLPMT